MRFLPPCLLGLLACAELVFSDPITPEARTFFETRIRPVLVERCFDCHSTSAKKLGGKLHLDSGEALLKGGESGPLLIPGKPEESLLLQALLHDGLEMPPETPLPEAVVHDFHEWVRMGAPYPQAEASKGSKASKGTTTPAGPDVHSTFWSFQPIRSPASPDAKRHDWARDPLDAFVLSRMEAADLTPTADATPPQLIRRLTIDLIGLPPTFDQVQAFVEEYERDRQQAVESCVDELLASPHFGERWGRHWLDVARYGEANGNDGLGRNATFPHAWRYRDYVIQAFNDDLPYNRFLTEQIAGDLLPAPSPHDRDRQLIATGFLAIGSKPAKAMNDNFDMDVVADQIDVVSTGVMGLSVACARCHDHKHDPISTRDYYAMAAIFQNTETLWGKAANEKLTAPPTPLHELQVGPDAKVVAAPAKILLDLPERYAEAVGVLQPALSARLDTPPKDITAGKDVNFTSDEFGVFRGGRLAGETSISNTAYSVSFWFRNQTPNKARLVTAYLFSRGPKGDKAAPGEHIGISGNYQGKAAGKLFVFNGNAGGKSVTGKTVVPPRTWNHVVLVRNGPQVKAWLNGLPEFEGELASTIGEATSFFIGARNDAFAPLEGNLAEWAFFDRALTDEEALRLHEASGLPKTPGPQIPGTSDGPEYLAMGVRDRAKMVECKINIKGESKKLGPVVPPGFPAVLMHDSTGPCAVMPEDQSGRLELAHWLTDSAHPLTARVMVNRIWQQLFGQALVATPDDFGVYGQRPTHPDLLDHLATRFVVDDWSVKKMIRSIVLSRTYQLSSTTDSQARARDPDNTWYSRHQRRRLDAESLRDSLLFAAGTLDPQPGRGSDIQDVDILLNWPMGEATNLHKPSRHRSVYLCMMRNAPPPELAAFDLPDGLRVAGRRSQTLLPSHALYLINSPVLVTHAQALAERLLADTHTDRATRVRRAYQAVLQREPRGLELQRALAYLGNDATNWASFCQALFITNEFRYID
ncbi:MAG: hypothetical protein ACI9TH_000780 [Kiritimatiellia bacterium]|jgi:hypothetical protein